MKVNRIAVMFAILAAALYAINIPLCKIILSHIAPTMLAAFLYLGAGVGLLLWRTFHKESSGSSPIGKSDMPYVIGMVVLDIATPICILICTAIFIPTAATIPTTHTTMRLPYVTTTHIKKTANTYRYWRFLSAISLSNTF